MENALLYGELHRGRVPASTEVLGKVGELARQSPHGNGTAKEGACPGTPTAKGRRILVVDDNVGTAKVLSLLLAKLGSHDVRMVHDGQSVLEAAKEHRPEIVLLDIGLPHVNGYEVAKRLRQQPEFQDTLLIALTGYGTEEDRRRSASVGFDRHLVKPPSLDDLRQVLAHLSWRRCRRAGGRPFVPQGLPPSSSCRLGQVRAKASDGPPSGLVSHR